MAACTAPGANSGGAFDLSTGEVEPERTGTICWKQQKFSVGEQAFTIDYLFPRPADFDRLAARGFRVVYTIRAAKPASATGGRAHASSEYRILGDPTDTFFQLGPRFDAGFPRPVSSWWPLDGLFDFAYDGFFQIGKPRTDDYLRIFDGGYTTRSMTLEQRLPDQLVEGGWPGESGVIWSEPRSPGGSRTPPEVSVIHVEGQPYAFLRSVEVHKEEDCSFTLVEAMQRAQLTLARTHRAQLARFHGRGYHFRGYGGKQGRQGNYIPFVSPTRARPEIESDPKSQQEPEPTPASVLVEHSVRQRVLQVPRGRAADCWAYDTNTIGAPRMQLMGLSWATCRDRNKYPIDVYTLEDDLGQHIYRISNEETSSGSEAEDPPHPPPPLSSAETPGHFMARMVERPSALLTAADQDPARIEHAFILVEARMPRRVLAECWLQQGRPHFWDFHPYYPNLNTFAKLALCDARLQPALVQAAGAR